MNTEFYNILVGYFVSILFKNIFLDKFLHKIIYEIRCLKTGKFNQSDDNVLSFDEFIRKRKK